MRQPSKPNSSISTQKLVGREISTQDAPISQLGSSSKFRSSPLPIFDTGCIRKCKLKSWLQKLDHRLSLLSKIDFSLNFLLFFVLLSATEGAYTRGYIYIYMNDRASVSWCILNSHVGRRRGKIRQVPCAASVMGFSPLPHRLWWYRERESLWLLPRSIAEWRRWRWALTCTILSAGYSRSIDENLETSFPVWWMTTDVAGYCLAFSALSSFLQSYTFFSYFLREPLSNDDVCPLRRGHCPAVHHPVFVCVGRFTILPIQSTMEKKLLYSWYRGLAATKLTSYSGCWRTGLQSHELFSLNCNAFEIPFRDATRCKIWLPFLKNGISRFKWFKSQSSFVN